MGTQRQRCSAGAAPCAISARSAALIPRPSILMSSWPGCWVGVVRWICLAGAARFVGVVSRCGSYGRLARSSMRFMRSSSSMVSTWAEVPWCSSPKHPIMCWAGTRPGVRILRPRKLSRQRTVTKQNPKEQQPSTTPTDSEAGVPHREPRPRPSSAECGHLYRLNTTAFAAANGATASVCQARALLTAIAPAPRSARMPAVPPRIVASLPVFASPWEGAVLLRTGVTGAVGVMPAGV